MKRSPKPSIIAFGFDKLDTYLNPKSFECDSFNLRAIKYGSEESVEDADGIIVPSGIFERWDHHNRGPFESARHIVDKSDLALREKQLLNAWKRGAWIVFAVRKVEFNRFSEDRDWDMCKRFMKQFVSSSRRHDPDPHCTCKSEEFRKYFDRFGIAETSFNFSNAASIRSLALLDNAPTAFEFKSEIFFLPMFVPKWQEAQLQQALTMLVEAVLEYRRKNTFYVPAWLRALRFHTEDQIEKDIQKTQEQLLQLESAQKKWERFKGILCTSGHKLNEIVVEVLREFFGVAVKYDEKFVEDASICDQDGKVRFVVEVKGINGGLRREHVNQVDSHRERLGLDPTVPGLLIINDFMDVEDFEERRAKPFAETHLEHAKSNNIRVLRTTSLFDIMRRCEDVAQRADIILSLCSSANPLVTLSDSRSS